MNSTRHSAFPLIHTPLLFIQRYYLTYKPRDLFSLFKAVYGILAVFLLLCGSLVSHAQPGIDREDIDQEREYDYFDRLDFDYQPAMHSSDLMGDTFDNHYGTVKFEYVDVSLPGNFDIEVAIRRSRAMSVGFMHAKFVSAFPMGAWVLETPRIVYKDVGNAHSLVEAFQSAKYCSGDYIRPINIYANDGPRLTVPGHVNNESLIRNTGVLDMNEQTYRFTTQSKWRIQCITVSGGEGFRATSPEGIVYTFDLRVEKEATGYLSEAGGATRDFVFYATKVEDRFGNWVHYNYEGGELRSITSSDSRGIHLTPTDSGVNIRANGRFWKYRNDGNEVTLPNGRKWVYSYNDPGWDNLSSADKTRCAIECGVHTKGIGTRIFYSQNPDSDNFSGVSQAANAPYKSSIGDNPLQRYPNVPFDSGSSPIKRVSSIKIQHPDGAIGEFWFGVSFHGVSNVQSYKTGGDNTGGVSELSSTMHIAPSLLKKRITYKSGEAYDWHYQYSNQTGYFKPRDNNTPNYPASFYIPDHIPVPANVDRTHFKVLKVIQPDDSYTLTYINRNADSLFEGKVFSERTYSKEHVLLQDVHYQYEAGTEWGNTPGGVFRVPQNTKKTLQMPRITQTKTLEYDAEGVATAFISSVSDFDAYDMPATMHYYNNFSDDQRYVKYGYHHDTRHWLLSQPARTEVSTNGVDYTLVNNTTFYTTSHSTPSLPSCYFSYGTQVYCATYWPDSTEKKVTYNALNRWLEYSDYKHGIAQTVKKPQNLGTADHKYAYKKVNDNGWVTQYTDYNGNCTNFGYDGMGWRTRIDPCDPQWDNTFISYSVTRDNDGLDHVAPGMIRQVANRGHYQKITYFDGMLRPRLVKEWDTQDSETVRYTRRNYDHNNQLTYESYASSSAATPQGATTRYDALGRVTESAETVISATTTHAYLSGNRIRMNDNKGHITTTTYLAYGSPDKMYPKHIEAPESVTTSIAYNVFGQPKRVTQGGLTEHHVYDRRQNLCKTVRPDIGNMAYSYNVLGELQWQAHGSSVDSVTTACDNHVLGEEKTIFTYDNVGNVHIIDYGDSSPDKTHGYDRNNNLTFLSAGGVTHNYRYTSLNTLSSETLSLDGKSYVVGYQYDGLGYLNHITYPSQREVSVKHNSLGQVNVLGSYVTDSTYHPSGGLHSLTYGNGITHTATANARQFPEDIYLESRIGSTLSDLFLSWDDNGNVRQIRDDRDSQYTVDMIYDGIDRLVHADGQWGVGRIGYDTLGNIKSQRLGAHTLTYHHDQQKRLENIRGSENYTFAYDSRGNVTGNGRRTFGYTLNGHMVDSSGIRFVYDGQNRRVKKTQGSASSYFIYSLNGQLLHKVSDTGEATDYIYHGKQLIAQDNTPLVLTEVLNNVSITFDGTNYAIPMTSRESSTIFRSFNLDDAPWMDARWDRLSDAGVRIEYKIERVSSLAAHRGTLDWTHFKTLSAGADGSRLPLDRNHVYPDFPDITVGSDAHNDIRGSYRNAIIHYRFRAERGGQTSEWQYMAPIWLRYRS